MQNLAQSWLIYRLTGSEFMVGALGFCAHMPVLLLGPLAGLAADRFSRYHVVLATQTSFLLQALDRGYRGYFITFPELVAELFQALADRSEQKLLKRYVSYDCLVIDEVGYVEVEPAQVGQFFTLMQKRHKKKTTLLTSNLGFSEWGSFLRNKQLTAALISRLTEISYVINMKDCESLRPTLEQ